MSAVPPGATIGIIGGGQLARMTALEARRMGYRIAVLDPDPDCPAAQVADVAVTGALDDETAAERLARQSAVVTIDTEHVPADVLERIGTLTLVRPGAGVLRLVQDRLQQRRFLAAQGAPQTGWAPVEDEASLLAAGDAVGFPCVLKTRRSGYDGKGQLRAARPSELRDAWQALARPPAVVESHVDFEREVSVVLARDVGGRIAFYPVAENTHRHHVLHVTRVPARISPALAAQAESVAARIAGALEYVGVMAVELFVTRQGQLLVNEIAPRTHNSGHFSFGACATSQFEQHVRAICGLPLADVSLLRPAAMLNLLGDLWQRGEPDWGVVLSRPTARLHLYGKRRASPGRKMGHVLVLGRDGSDAAEVAGEIARELERGGAAAA